MGFADDFIDVIAIDALKRANLESDPRGLNVRQNQWTQALGTGMGLNCYAACVEQDCQGRHNDHLNSGGSVTELSVTDRCRDGTVMMAVIEQHGTSTLLPLVKFAHFRKVNNSERAHDGASLPKALGAPCECPLLGIKWDS